MGGVLLRYTVLSCGRFHHEIQRRSHEVLGSSDERGNTGGEDLPAFEADRKTAGGTVGEIARLRELNQLRVKSEIVKSGGKGRIPFTLFTDH